MTAGGLLVIVITICIGAFLVYKGSGTFTIFHHSLSDFLFSADWGPADNAEGGGTVGALIFIVGSLCTCGLALLIATPFALGSAIFMIEIAPKFGEKFYRPIVEIFAGIPSVVYGWVGLTVLIPAIKKIFGLQVGHSILAAGIVLALMIFPTISNVAADSISSVPKDYRMAAYGLGSTRWQSIIKLYFRQQAQEFFPVLSLDLQEHLVRRLQLQWLSDRRQHFQLAFSLRQRDYNGDCGTDGKCDRRWRDEDSTLDNGITFIRIVPCIYSADPLFLQTEERQRVRRRREDEQNKTCAWNQ